MRALTLGACVAAGALAAGCATLDVNWWPQFGGPSTASGKTIAMQQCSACHGMDGNPESPNFPRLAGQNEAYLVKQLDEFHAQHRVDPAGTQYMWGLARNLTPTQIQEIAAYFSAQKPRSVPVGDPKLAAEGKEIFERGLPDKGVPACVGCHGANAAGSAETPRLAGQWAHYILAQLQVFHTEERPAGVAMHAIVTNLTEQDERALADYLQSIPAN